MNSNVQELFVNNGLYCHAFSHNICFEEDSPGWRLIEKISLKEKRILMCPVSSGGQERREDYYVSANKKKRQGWRIIL